MAFLKQTLILFTLSSWTPNKAVAILGDGTFCFTACSTNLYKTALKRSHQMWIHRLLVAAWIKSNKNCWLNIPSINVPRFSDFASLCISGLQKTFFLSVNKIRVNGNHHGALMAPEQTECHDDVIDIASISGISEMSEMLRRSKDILRYILKYLWSQIRPKGPSSDGKDKTGAYYVDVVQPAKHCPCMQ